MIRKISFFFISLFIFLACGQKNSKPNKPAAAVSQFIGNPLPQAIRDDLLMKATNIDVVFFNLPISMNQDDKYSVNKSIMFMNLDAPLQTLKAPAIGRLSILDNGEVLRDIDIHHNGKEMYYAIYENNKPTYYCTISQTGKNFYNNLINQAGGL